MLEGKQVITAQNHILGILKSEIQVSSGIPGFLPELKLDGKLYCAWLIWQQPDDYHLDNIRQEMWFWLGTSASEFLTELKENTPTEFRVMSIWLVDYGLLDHAMEVSTSLLYAHKRATS